ncbi:MAG: hypothetical protein Q9213_002051 [Squamulea squamosa]
MAQTNELPAKPVEDLDDMVYVSDEEESMNANVKPPSSSTEPGMIPEIKAFYPGEGDDFAGRYPLDFPDPEETDENARYALVIRYARCYDGRRNFTLSSIVVQSPLLKKVLGWVLKDYPRMAPELDRLELVCPFRPFVHRWQRLINALEWEQDPETKSHIQLFYDALKTELDLTLKTRNDFIDHKTITFNALWMIFSPGDIICTTYHNREVCARFIDSVIDSGRHEDLYRLECEMIHSDGTSFGWGPHSFGIPEFAGLKKIYELPVYPLNFHRHVDKITRKLVNNGQAYERLFGFHHKQYQGIARDGQFPFYVNSRIIVDAETYGCHHPRQIRLKPLKKAEFQDVHKTATTLDHSEHSDSSDTEEEVAETTSKINKSNTISALTDEQRMVCGATVKGYSLRNKRWLDFFVDNIKDIDWKENAKDDVVLEEEQKDLIFSMVEGHRLNHQGVQTKGLNILICGPTGVGKTLTVESVAESLRAPLLYLTSADLDVDPKDPDLESPFTDLLDMCGKWNMILLLDQVNGRLDGDMLDKEESTEYTSLLRALESHATAFFVTCYSSAEDCMDNRFLSRFHMTLDLPELSTATRESIWQKCLESHKDISFFVDRKTLADWPLNGREIANAVTAAKTLVRNGTLDMKHLERVIPASKRPIVKDPIIKDFWGFPPVSKGKKKNKAKKPVVETIEEPVKRDDDDWGNWSINGTKKSSKKDLVGSKEPDSLGNHQEQDAEKAVDTEAIRKNRTSNWVGSDITNDNTIFSPPPRDINETSQRNKDAWRFAAAEVEDKWGFRAKLPEKEEQANVKEPEEPEVPASPPLVEVDDGWGGFGIKKNKRSKKIALEEAEDVVPAKVVHVPGLQPVPDSDDGWGGFGIKKNKKTKKIALEDVEDVMPAKVVHVAGLFPAPDNDDGWGGFGSKKNKKSKKVALKDTEDAMPAEDFKDKESLPVPDIDDDWGSFGLKKDKKAKKTSSKVPEAPASSLEPAAAPAETTTATEALLPPVEVDEWDFWASSKKTKKGKNKAVVDEPFAVADHSAEDVPLAIKSASEEGRGIEDVRVLHNCPTCEVEGTKWSVRHGDHCEKCGALFDHGAAKRDVVQPVQLSQCRTCTEYQGVMKGHFCKRCGTYEGTRKIVCKSCALEKGFNKYKVLELPCELSLASITMTPPTPPEFLSLPREIQNAIYNLLLLSPDDARRNLEAGIVRPYKWDSEDENNHLLTFTTGLHSAILATCQTIAREASPILYAGNHFHMWWSHASHFVAMIGPRNANLLASFGVENFLTYEIPNNLLLDRTFRHCDGLRRLRVRSEMLASDGVDGYLESAFFFFERAQALLKVHPRLRMAVSPYEDGLEGQSLVQPYQEIDVSFVGGREADYLECFVGGEVIVIDWILCQGGYRGVLAIEYVEQIEEETLHHVSVFHYAMDQERANATANFAYLFKPAEMPTKVQYADPETVSQRSTDHRDAVHAQQLESPLENTIFEKEIKSKRARFSPAIKYKDGIEAHPEARTGSQSNSPVSIRKKRKNPPLGVQYGHADNTVLRQILLNWGKEKPQVDSAQRYVLNATVVIKGTKIESRDSVIWQHSNVEDIELDEMNNLIARLKTAGLDESMVGLSKRLLNRVRLVMQRDFVHGRFLTPQVLRYDLNNGSKYSHDRCCMFVSFPYFALDEARKQSIIKKGDARHPVRTLLQSRCRLNETTDKDESQCVRMVGASALRSCIREASSKDLERLTRKTNTELIYVPQMWAVILGQDHILTGHVLSDVTWATIQRLSSDPILELWMDTPKPGAIIPSWNPRSDAQFVITNPSSIPPPAIVGFEELGRVPVVRAFLAWRVMDDYGEINDCSVEVQTKHFLNAVYEALAVKYVDDTFDLGVHDQSNKETQQGPRPKLDILGKKLEDVRGLDSMAFPGRTEKSIKERLLETFEELFRYFIPEDHDQDSPSVRLFWGALHALLELNVPFLGRFLDKTLEIRTCASRLHIGVHFERYKDSQDRPDDYEDEISDSAILQESMIGALTALFSMLIEVVRGGRTAPNSRSPEKLPRSVKENGDEACRLLNEAWDQLIEEATGATPETGVGPIVTPEAILIKTMSRLTRGVFGSGNVDVTNVLEERLEQLALQVEKHSSRRLLQRLNALEEEVDIIGDIICQQTDVLEQLRHCLDPEAFEKPTMARKMRFVFEEPEIETVVAHLKEQLRCCEELRTRVINLQVENVQLVETLADDNSRAIFVFTFITVLFLPLSFVATFFGMNLAGIADSTSKVSDFWYIAVPFTVGILVLCALFLAWGETFWFAAMDLSGVWKRLLFGKVNRRQG